MRPLLQSLAAAVVGAGCLLSVVGTGAQAQSQSQVQNPPAASISEQKLSATAAAMQKVASLHEQYQQQIATAPDTEKERIAQKASDAMTKAVTDQGLSVDEYRSILKVAENDPTLRAKLLQRMQSSGK